LTAPRVLVAHEEEAIRDAAIRAAQSAGYEAVGVADGDSALVVLLSQPTPAALVVDVGLRGKAGYELIDEIRRHELGTRVVLIASVYSKTAYKRKPTSLYGADDYVEQHHVVDMLAPKLADLVPPPQPPPELSVHGEAGLPPEVRRESEYIRDHRDARLQADAGHADAVTRAAALARLIVADLVLYNGTEVEQWLAGREAGDGGSLPGRVLTDLEEARRLFAIGVPRDVAGQRDFVLEALMEFLEGRG
jgi:CheY-like chemotaxis protein